MFDIGSTELLLIVIVAIVVIGPKDLPRALYKVGQIVGKARGMARHFRTGIDAMVREVEMQELEKKWADQNKRIMEEHPAETIVADSAAGDSIIEHKAAEEAAPQLALSDTPITPLSVTPSPASAVPAKSDESA